MRRITWLFAVAVIAAALLLGTPRFAAARAANEHAVFIQTNNPTGNAIVAYRRHADGTLTRAATYPTGGDGGRETGATSDPLASQGSLVFDANDELLFAVNAGSNTISVFAVQGDQLHLHQTISSGGSFPVGFALRGSLLYVLNAGLAGDVSGFQISNGQLSPIPGSTRSLGLANATPPFFLTSPAEVGFTPSGSQLVVTTKENDLVEVFSVNPHGLLSGQPVKNRLAGIPFAFRFDGAGHFILVSAASGFTSAGPTPNSGSVQSFTINPDGTLASNGAPVTNGQTAACWITPVHGFDYVANTGSETISQYSISSTGAVTLVNALAASGIAGPTDLATAGGFLYNQAGLASSVDVFAVNADGSLAVVQTPSVPNGGSQEGIVAN